MEISDSSIDKSKLSTFLFQVLFSTHMDLFVLMEFIRILMGASY